jgi:hypothetical protein
VLKKNGFGSGTAKRPRHNGEVTADIIAAASFTVRFCLDCSIDNNDCFIDTYNVSEAQSIRDLLIAAQE